MRQVLQVKYYNLHTTRTDEKYLVQTRSQTKSSRVKLPEVHGIEKSLDPHIKPGRQKVVSPSMDTRHLFQSLGLDKVEQELREKQR